MTEATVTPSTLQRVLCDVAGAVTVCLATLLAVVALCSLGVFRNGVVVWLVACLILEGASFYMWYASSKAQKMDSGEWLAGVIFTPLVGAAFFAIDVFTGSAHGQYNSFIESASHAGSPFGIVLTIAVCPVGTILCAGGWVRTELRERLLPVSMTEN
jgi:hypothetical protein